LTPLVGIKHRLLEAPIDRIHHFHSLLPQIGQERCLLTELIDESDILVYGISKSPWTIEGEGRGGKDGFVHHTTIRTSWTIVGIYITGGKASKGMVD